MKQDLINEIIQNINGLLSNTTQKEKEKFLENEKYYELEESDAIYLLKVFKVKIIYDYSFKNYFEDLDYSFHSIKQIKLISLSQGEFDLINTKCPDGFFIESKENFEFNFEFNVIKNDLKLIGGGCLSQDILDIYTLAIELKDEEIILHNYYNIENKQEYQSLKFQINNKILGMLQPNNYKEIKSLIYHDNIYITLQERYL